MTTPSRSRGRPPVPLDRIIAAAIEILDGGGGDALSMRSLAQRLDSGTATLYRHFSGRADLIARVVDAVMGEVNVDTGIFTSLPWQQACETLARSMFDVLCRHPHVAPLMMDPVPVGPHMLTLRERALAVLLAAGFPPPLALRAWATVARYVLGIALQLTAPDGGQPQLAEWAEVDLTHFPATVAVAEHVPVSLDSEFEFGLELLIGGLQARLAHHEG
ncbi:TetR/AcrR family transcriptional regulator [Mycolicibacterium komossense]|uniref:TetR/AcrR family transcriptional regulator n=1 Tax=Mycolicibacterium komossense TaxID=1779 RepID=UPI0021F3742E|nr:TetR/AcrR family transcriptional regulator [Mycolicibacterium komossense]